MVAAMAATTSLLVMAVSCVMMHVHTSSVSPRYQLAQDWGQGWLLLRPPPLLLQRWRRYRQHDSGQQRLLHHTNNNAVSVCPPSLLRRSGWTLRWT